MSYVAGRAGVTRNLVAQQSAMHRRQVNATIQRNNQRHRLMQQNLRLARSAVTEVVHELAEALPTSDELQLLMDLAREAEEHDLAPEQIEARLEGTRLWPSLKVLAKENEQRIFNCLMLLAAIITICIELNPPQPPPPQVTINVTVDATR